ncbi:MAG: peptidoglycan-binding protein [Mastigocoleus sp.]
MTFSTSILLKEGSKGAEVKQLQEALQTLNFYFSKIDGVFGANTKVAVINFQKNQGLVADGIVGSKTWSKINQLLNSQTPKDKWRLMNPSEEVNEIKSLINSPMGIAALNQVALEGFVGFDCRQSFYLNEPFGGFQTLMRVQCHNPRGVSVAASYNELRVIFNRFEGNIENFEVQRVGEDYPAKFELP